MFLPTEHFMDDIQADKIKTTPVMKLVILSSGTEHL